MFGTEFHSEDELEQIKNNLAVATRHPVVIDRTSDYQAVVEGDYEPRTATNVMPDRSAIWNSRDDRLAYISTGKYNLVQHREVIDAIEEAIDMTVGEIDFGVVRDYGEQVDGILVFGNQAEANIDMSELLGDSYIPPEDRPETDPTAETSRWRDTVGLGMRFTNSFNGAKKISGSTMGYRYICQNWLVWDEETIGERTEAHVREYDEDDGLAEGFFEPLIMEVFDIREDVQEILVEAEGIDVPLTWVPGLLEEIGYGRNYQKRIAERTLGYNNPSDEETTLWRLYNAVTREIDHHTAESVGLGTYNAHQSRAWNLVHRDDVEEPEETMELEELVEWVA